MNLKQMVLMFMFFACFNNYVSPDDTDVKFAPVDKEIVNILQILRNSGNELNSLKFRLSIPFSLKISEQNNTAKFEIIDGALVSNEKTPKKIQFNTDDTGTLRTFTSNAPEGIETFVVDFQSGTEVISLGFKRNIQRNNFVLFSVLLDTERYNIRTEIEPPYLTIFTDIIKSSGIKELEAVPFFSSGNVKQSSVHNINTSLSVSGRSRDIMGHSSVIKGGIIAYVVSQNSTVNRDTLNRLIDIYINEAEIEGINLDIAIAQMLHATSFLRQRMTTRNYAGLSVNKTNGWNGSFNNMTEGVQAHIQHLKGYTSMNFPSRKIVDPRYDLLGDIRGRVRTFGQLYEMWSQNQDYGNKIDKILGDLYRFSDMLY